MELKPGYKQTEVGVIPEDWSAEPLGSHVEINSGESPSGFRFENSGIPYFKVEQLNNDSKYLEATPYYFRGDKKVIHGSLIFPKRGASIFLNKVRILKHDSFMDTNLMTITPKHSLNNEYLYYALTHIQLWRIADTTSIPQINNKHINPLVVPIPLVEEQRAIAESLSDVDALINGLDQLIAKKHDLKQAAMQQLLTGKQRLPGFSKKPGYKQSEVGLVPENWDVAALGDIFNISGGFSASRDQLTSEGHCYLHYGDIHTSVKSFIDVRTEYSDIPKLNIPLKRISSKSLLADGDIVFVDASEDDEGTSKHIVVINPEGVPYISGLHTIIAKSKTPSLDNGYKRYCFQTSNVKRQFYFYAVGTKVSGISKTNIKKIFIPLPPFPEQTAIATVLADMDAEIVALEQRRDKTRALKQGMMQELLTGRIRLV